MNHTKQNNKQYYKLYIIYNRYYNVDSRYFIKSGTV